MTPQSNFTIALILFVIGAVGSILLRKKDNYANLFGNLFAIAGSIFGLATAYNTLILHNEFVFNISSSLPNLTYSIKMDNLSAFFVFVISLISLLASIYAIGYVKHYYKKYSIGSLGFFYNIFILGMLLVSTAHNALFFLIVWEIMSLASYFLVIYEKNEDKNIKAGSLYFAMTHIGTAFIILAFILLYRSIGSFDFETIRNNIGTVTPLVKNIVFISAFIGFGTKAGVIPFHIWLPSAHPAAPSHVSALMSGVMIKTGIYMIIRLFMVIMPNAPLWWGIAILILGAASSLLGVLYALAEHDIKKLLAYHSIENIGIILLGIGSSLVFSSFGLKSLANLSLIAALFHTLNHAVFKALLFMAAGSVIQKTHTRNIEKYGGLIKAMPYTALFFLVGSMAISALPPLNGFASEWLTYQAIFAGIGSFDSVSQWSFVLAAASLAVTGGLAAACFVKVFGITFLARPRSDEANKATESSFSLNLSMGFLAILTLILGLFAKPISKILSTIIEGTTHLNSTAFISNSNSTSIITQNKFASLSMPSIFFLLLTVCIFVVILVKYISRSQKVKIAPTWDCGSVLSPRMELTATGFSRSIISIFKSILNPTQEIETEFYNQDQGYFLKSSKVKFGISDIYKSYFYSPLQELIIKIAEYAKKIQSGNVNAYILYIFLTLILLLLIGATK